MKETWVWGVSDLSGTQGSGRGPVCGSFPTLHRFGVYQSSQGCRGLGGESGSFSILQVKIRRPGAPNLSSNVKQLVGLGQP